MHFVNQVTVFFILSVCEMLPYPHITYLLILYCQCWFQLSVWCWVQVAVIEKGPLKGRAQEWYISRKELMVLQEVSSQQHYQNCENVSFHLIMIFVLRKAVHEY